MHPPSIPEALELASAMLIATISAVVSITRRLVQGHAYSLLWVTSEFLTAILCGYLMYESYPNISPYLPEWLTLPVAIAVAAHSGGRVFQEVELFLVTQYGSVFTRKK